MDPLLKNTLEYFNKTLIYLDLPSGLIEWFTHPQHNYVVTVPIKTDRGETKIFTGYRIQYENVFGCFKGGMRYTPDINIEESTALAKGMSTKCRVHNLPLGGAKGGLCIDTKKHGKGEQRRATKRLISELIKHIGPEMDVLAPDMYTNEETMMWMVDAYKVLTKKDRPGVVTGKPAKYGGILGRNIATGAGCYYVILETAKDQNINIAESKIIVDGCGNAAIPLIKQLSKDGAKIVGVSDSQGGTYNPRGLNTKKLLKTKEETSSVINFKEGDPIIPSEKTLELNCDILILAAKQNRATKDNADKIKAGWIFEPSNGPTTPEAHDIFLDRGIYVSPDPLDSGGGIIVSWFEMIQGFPWSLNLVLTRLKKIISNSYQNIQRTMKEYKLTDRRLAANIYATKELAKAAQERGFWP